MTRASLREYAAVQRERYEHATRAEKRQLLDEIVAVTGMHRKAAIRLLRRAPRASAGALAGGPAARATAPPSPRRPRCCGRPAGASAPTAASLRARAARAADPVWRTHGGPRGRQAPAPGQSATLARLLAPARAQLPPRGVHHDPARHLAQARDPHPHLHRVGRRAARVLRGGSRRPLRQQHPGLLPLHPLRRRYRDRPGSSSKPSGARARRGSAPPSTTSASACPVPLRRPGQRQRLGVHQPPPLYVVPARGHHLHPQPRLQEERQRPRRAEERRRRPAAHRL